MSRILVLNLSKFQYLRKNVDLLSKCLINLNHINLGLNYQIRNLKYRPIETQNKIEIGHKMTQVIEKNRQKYLVKKIENEKYSNSYLISKPNRRLLIACSSPAFNHYTDQAYKNFSERNLASLGWRNRRSAGQYFTINSIRSHPSLIDNMKVRNDKGEIIEFEDFNLNSNLIDLIKNNLDLKQPTLIQYLGLNEILKRDNHKLIIAETGGGKTLTYVLPLIEYTVRLKKYLDEIKIKRNNKQPIGIILVPTRELAFQVYNLFNRLLKIKNEPQLNTEEDEQYLNSLKNLNIVIDLHKSQIKAKEIISKQKLNSLNELDEKPIDILITLPGQLEERQNSNYFDSTYLRQFVLDEADTLLDDSFSQMTLKCLNGLKMCLELPQVNIPNNQISDESVENYQEFEDKSKKYQEFIVGLDLKLKDPSTQLLFVSATMPRDIKNILQDLINCDNELQKITTNKTHRLMLHVPQKFIRSNGTKRPEQLLEIVKKELDKKNNKRTIMIFSHRTNTATYVYKFLKENKIDCELLTKKLNNQQREEVVNKFFNGEIRVLCCTDIASRGWDTLHVNHVINFEMPQFIADYLHRVGRVGRLNGHKYGGNGGLVTNFITNRFEVDLVWNIERSIRLGVELHNVNANIKRLYKFSYMNEAERKEEPIKDQNHDENKNLKINLETQDEESNYQESEEPTDQIVEATQSRVRRTRRGKPNE